MAARPITVPPPVLCSSPHHLASAGVGVSSTGPPSPTNPRCGIGGPTGVGMLFSRENPSPRKSFLCKNQSVLLLCPLFIDRMAYHITHA
jgi:hypothetical protein